MNDSQFNEFYPQLAQKGYTRSECRILPADEHVPDWYASVHPGATLQEYKDCVHEFMNGLWTIFLNSLITFGHSTDQTTLYILSRD